LKLNPDDVIDANLRAVQLEPNNFFSYYNLGKAYELKGCFREAVSAYQKAITIHREDPYAHLSLGELLARLGHQQEAIACFQRALGLSPGLLIAHIELGKLLYELDRLDEAIIRFKKAVNLEPESSSGYFWLARVYRKIGFLKEAVDAANQAVTLNPKNTHYQCFRADLLLKLGEPAKARASLIKLSSFQDDDQQVYRLIGDACYALGEWEEARRAYLQALALEPYFMAAIYGLGKVLMRLSHFKEAEQTFLKIFKIDPLFGPAHFELAQLAAERTQWSIALQHLNQVPEEMEGEVEFLLLRAKVFRACNRLEEASSDLRYLEENRVFREDAYLLWGDVYMDRMELQTAREKYRIALEIHPDSVKALEKLAFVEAQLGNELESEQYLLRLQTLPPREEKSGVNSDGAVDAVSNIDEPEWIEGFEQALKKEPENPDLYLAFGDSLFDNGDVDKAIQMWETGLPLAVSEVDFMMRLGEGYRVKGKSRASYDCFEKCLQLAPDSVDVYTALGRHYFEAGEFDKARELLSRGALRFPKDIIFPVLLLRIASMEENDEDVNELVSVILERESGNLAAISAQGLQALKHGDLEKAASCFQRNLSTTGGKDRESLYYLGLIARLKGDVRDACDFFQRVIRLRPDDAFSHFNLGLIFQKMGNHLMAEHHLKLALKYDPEDRQIFRQLGMLYSEQGDYAKAVELFLRVVREEEDFMSLLQLGISFMELNQYKKADYYFEKAYRIEPREVEVIYHRAVCQEELGNYQASIALAKQGLSMIEAGNNSLKMYLSELFNRVRQKQSDL
jgi:tetratricopeptide (TPR) repeat protein